LLFSQIAKILINPDNLKTYNDGPDKGYFPKEVANNLPSTNNYYI